MNALPEERIERLMSHRLWLRAVARDLVREPSLAEDLVQETWLAALAHPPQGPERPWLAAVARRAALFLGRSEGRRRTREERAARPEAVTSPAELHERMEIEERLVHELRALAEPFRTTLLRRYFEGLGAAEIARVEGVPEGTVRWRTKRGLEELRRRLAPALGERESFALALAPLLEVAPGGVVAGGASLGGALLGWKGWVGAAAVVVLGFAAARIWSGREGASPEPDALVVAAAPEVILEREETQRDERGTPAAETSAREPVEPDPEDWIPRVRVVDARGRTVAEAAVQWRARGEDGHEEATLDAAGVITWPEGSEGPIDLVVARPRCFPHVAELDLSPGEQVLVLPGGLELSGTVLVDGSVPRRPLRLELFPSRGAAAYREAPAASLFERDRVAVVTDARGGFTFSDLQTREYELVVPRGHAFAGDIELADPDVGQTVRLRPGTRQLLELERFPSVHGRVRLASGAPAPAELTAYVRWNGLNTMGLGAATDETGFFELFFARSWRTLSIECDARAAGAGGEFTYESAALEDGDLGDLVLEPGQSLVLRVLDEAGAPIEGAVTTAGSASSDADGKLELACVSQPFVVAAFGYLPREVRPVGGEAEVRLAAGPSFELLVLDVQGVPVPGAPLRFEADHTLFDGPGGRVEAAVWRSDPARVGRFRTAGNRRQGGIYAEFVGSRDGRWRTGGVLAGVPFRLRVGFRDQPPFHEELVSALAPVEHRRIEVRLSLSLARLHGRALDPEGRGAHGVRCTVEGAPFHGHGEELGCSSDARGRFECFLLLAPATHGPVPIRLTCGGFREHALAWDPAAPEPLEVRLDPGRRVRVTVVDSAGQVIPGGKVGMRRLGSPAWSGTGRLRPGVFEAGGLEDGLHEFRLELASREVTRTHSVPGEELRFVVERPARVRVDWNITNAQPAPRWVEVRLLPREEGGLTYRADPDELSDARVGAAEFRAVVPGAYEAVLYAQADDELVEQERRSFEVAEGDVIEVEVGRE